MQNDRASSTQRSGSRQLISWFCSLQLSRGSMFTWYLCFGHLHICWYLHHVWYLTRSEILEKPGEPVSELLGRLFTCAHRVCLVALPSFVAMATRLTYSLVGDSSLYTKKHNGDKHLGLYRTATEWSWLQGVNGVNCRHARIRGKICEQTVNMWEFISSSYLYIDEARILNPNGIVSFNLS